MLNILLEGGGDLSELEPSPRNKVQEQFGVLLKNKEKGLWLERGIYALTIEELQRSRLKCKWTEGPFMEMYVFKVSEFRDYLKHNKSFLTRLKKMSMLDIRNAPYKEINKLFPKKWSNILNKYKGEKEAENFVETTNAFTCGKCKSKECVATAPQQTRSADEGMTISITCTKCGNKWVQ